jgi:hypothetical protein
MIIVQPYLELSTRQAVYDRPLQFDLVLFFGQGILLSRVSLVEFLPRVSLPLPASSPANRTLLLDPAHFARRDVPSFPPRFAQDAFLHNFFSESLEQRFLRLALPQAHHCQKTHPLPGLDFFALRSLEKQNPACPPTEAR